MTLEQIKTIYPAPDNHKALAYHVPIALLDEVRQTFKSAGISIRVRYRGPRINTFGSHTLKADAVSFSVYNKE
jgi:hypothetical protein